MTLKPKDVALCIPSVEHVQKLQLKMGLHSD